MSCIPFPSERSAMTYPKSLDDKVALVIGGSGAIGTATSRMLAEAGAKVAITHRPNERLAEAASAILHGMPGQGHSAHSADITDTASLLRLRDAIAQRYGRLDILVNAAGFTKPVPHA